MSSDPQYIYAEGSAISKFVEMTLTVVIGSVQSVTAYINPGSLLTNDGDISNTSVGVLDNIIETFPIPAAEEKSKKFFGKVKKFLVDIKSWMSGVCMLGQIVNNCVTARGDLPGSANNDKVLMDLYTNLSSDFTATKNDIAAIPGKYILRSAVIEAGATGYAPDRNLYNGYYRIGMLVVYVGVEGTMTECDILLINTTSDSTESGGDLKIISSTVTATGTSTPNIRYYLYNGVLCIENLSGKKCTVNIAFYPAV